jgi:hypothetical protein
MKLWAKTIGLNQILLVTLATVIANQFAGNVTLNLPTLQSGIRFIETPLTSLLTTFIPTVIYLNRSRAKIKTIPKTERLARFFERALLPMSILVTFVTLSLLKLDDERNRTLLLGTLVLGLVAAAGFKITPRTGAFMPVCVYLSFHTFTNNGFEKVLQVLQEAANLH